MRADCYHADAMQAIFFWLYNVPPDETMRTVYTDPHPNYMEEKLGIYQKSITLWLGTLDTRHRDKLFNAAWARYGETVIAQRLSEELYEAEIGGAG